MSYQVLARKWRPRQFDTMAGQTHVLRALQNALEQNRLHHAYLFTGTRGVGKTTVARIFAKALNCEQGISAHPCGQCDICQSIDAGRLVDLIEVDAASRTKVEDTRELLDNVQYLPSRARFKIYLIDEVHMLSTHSFNALLKTLEEPPPHVKFLLATTDPQKLPVTVLSRCLQFHLKNLPVMPIQHYLESVLKQEQISFESPAVAQIARVAKGSMRDALSLLDQAIAFCQGQLNQRDVSDMLGLVSQDAIEGLLTYLADQKGTELLNQVQQLTESGADFHQVLEELINSLHQIAIAQTVPAAVREDLSVNPEAIRTFAQRFSKEDVQLYYQIALHGRRDLALATDSRTGMEMTLLRMLAFKPQTLSTAPISKPVIKTTQPAATAAAAAAATTTKPPPETSAPIIERAARAAGIENDWSQLITQLALTGAAKLLASHCDLHHWEGNQLNLTLSPQYSALLNDRIQERLTEALSSYLQKKVKLSIQLGQSQSATPAEKAALEKEHQQDALMTTLQNDPHLGNLLNTFEISLDPKMVKPLSPSL